MTDILLQVDNLPQDIKTHMYGFIHIEDRVKMLMEQYYDMLISNNSIWYQLVNHLDEELLEIFNSHSYELYDKLGFPRVPLFILNNSFPNLNETIHFSRNKIQKTRHPFYDDIASFIRRGFKICDKDKFNVSRRRFESYKQYLIYNRVNILNNFRNQFELCSWKTYENDFDKKYLELMFNHLRKVIISIHRPCVVKKIKKAFDEFEIGQRVVIEKKEERDRELLEGIRMKYEERLSKIRQKTMNKQNRRLLQQQKLEKLELESAKRKDEVKAKRREIELQRKQDKEAKRSAILKKKDEKENARKVREHLARQREEDRMIAKMMQAMFTVKNQKPKVDRGAQKEIRQKIKVQKECNRVDKEIFKAIQDMFKVTKERTPKTST